jgi:glycosyltransferase involved in cell wall biosynthesis
MRILLLQDYLRNGGTERQTILLANALTTAGCEATVLTFRPGGALATTAAAAVGRRVLQRFDTGLDWFAPGLCRAIAEIAPDILLCMGRMANCYAGFAARRFPALPVICTMRTGKQLPLLYRRSLCLAAGIVANSQFAAQTLSRDYGVAPEKIAVIHNAPVFEAEVVVAAAPLSPSPPPPLPPTLLCVAMFRPEKAHAALLEAAALLPRDRAWRLVLAGDGPARAACQRLAQKLGLAGRVEFPGFLADPRLLYREATVAVLASRSESLPNFLVEAHLSGVPSVACEVGGVAECGGITVPSGDIQGLAAEAAALLFDNARRAAESRRVAEYARLHFSREAQLAAYLAFFQRCSGAFRRSADASS